MSNWDCECKEEGMRKGARRMSKEELIKWIKREYSEDNDFYNELNDELDREFERRDIEIWNEALQEMGKKIRSIRLSDFEDSLPQSLLLKDIEALRKK